jgi:hypothetical protein
MQTRLLGRILGSVWEDIVTAVGDYEKAESKVIGKKYLRPAEKGGLLSRLRSMERMAEKWLNDPAHRRRYERNVDVSEAAGLDEATQRDIRRAGMLKLLLPRIRLERLDVESGRVLEGGSFSDAALVGESKDQAVGDATKKLDIVSHRVNGRDQQGFFAHDEYGPHRNLGNALFEGGADQMAPNLGARAVAMSRLAELLDVPILAKTDFGTHTSETVLVDQM